MTDINGQIIYHFHPNNSTIFNLIWDKFDGANLTKEIVQIHAVDKTDVIDKINSILIRDGYMIKDKSFDNTIIYA